jgi:hypothetical protein
MTESPEGWSPTGLSLPYQTRPEPLERLRSECDRMTVPTGSAACERKVGSWQDRDRDGSWQMYSMCRACGEMRHCRGKERDRVRCFDCFMVDAEAVPMIELNLCTYTSREEALAALEKGREMLRLREQAATEARLATLAETNERKRLEREYRDEEIAYLYHEQGLSLDELAADFELKPGTVKKIVSRPLEIAA